MPRFDLGSLQSRYNPYSGCFDISIAADPSNRVKSFDKILHRSLSQMFGERSPSISEESKETVRDRNFSFEPILDQEPVLSRHFSREKLGKLSLLWIAVLGSYHRSAELLVLSGADVNETFGRHDPQVIDEKWTILHVLLQIAENSRLIHLVTYRGTADLQAQDSVGRSVLHFAVQQNRAKLVEMFLKEGAHVNAANYRGETPLLVAARGAKTYGLLPLLIKYGADVTAKTSNGENVLHVLAFAFLGAVQRRTDGILQRAGLAIAMGASLDDKEDSNLYQPIHEAASWGSSELVKLYLDHGANVNTLAEYGNSPLYLAAGRRRSDVLQTLLKRGANIVVRTIEGRTALHRACESFREENIRVLLSAGADVLVEDCNGKTPFALIEHEKKNIQNASIKLMLKALALKRLCSEPSVGMKDERIIKQYPKLWDYFQYCLAHTSCMVSAKL